MKLWLLRPIDRYSGPWEPWYDKNFGFVVRSETKDAARKIAAENGRRENPHYEKSDDSPWLDDSKSSCTELLPCGDEELIIRDFAAA